MLRPAHRIAEGRGAFAAGVVAQRPRHPQEETPWNPAGLLYHLRRVPREMALQNLENTPGMVERRVGFPHPRLGPFRARLARDLLARSRRRGGLRPPVSPRPYVV